MNNHDKKKSKKNILDEEEFYDDIDYDYENEKNRKDKIRKARDDKKTMKEIEW